MHLTLHAFSRLQHAHNQKCISHTWLFLRMHTQFVCECNHEQERASEFAESCLLVVLESDPICESLRLHMYMRTLCVCPHHDWRNVACACPSTEHAWMQVCIYYIIHDDNAVGTPVVSIGDCPESLLTGSVPYLERIKIHHTSSR